MKKHSPLIIVPLALILFACSGTPAKQPRSSADPDGLKGNSLYYYLAANFKALKGDEGASQAYFSKAFKKSPGSTHLKIQRAYQLARESKFDEARKLAEEAVAENPSNADAHLLLGKIALSLDRAVDAAAPLEKAIKLDPKNEEAYMILSRSQSMLGRTDEAVQTMRRLIQANPESTRGYYFLANIYATEKKNLDLALTQYETILNYDPDDLKAWQLIAEIHLARKDYKKALEALTRVAEINPQDVNTQVRIALLHFELKNKDKAIEAFEGILDDNPEADKIQYYLGLLYLDKEDYTKAQEYFGRIKESSTFYEDAVSRQVAVLIRQKKSAEALEVAARALKKNPNKKTFYEIVASVHALDSNFEAALGVLKSGLKAAPQNEDLLFSQGVLLEKTGQWEKAIEVMREVLTVNPDNAQALNFIGYTYADKEQNLDEAQDLIERALKVKPGDGYIIDSLGWVYFKKGNLAKATELLERANRLAPGEPTILEHLGDVYLKAGDKRRARAQYEKAIFALNGKTQKTRKDEAQVEIIRKKIAGL